MVDKYITLRSRLDEIQKQYRKQGVEVKDIIGTFIEDIQNNLHKDLTKEEYKNVDLIAQMQGAIYKKGNSGDDVVFTPTFIAEAMTKLLNISENDVVIDLCVGTGSLMVANTDYNHYFGFDISKELLEKANINANLKGISDKVTLTRLDGTTPLKETLCNKKATKAILNPPYSYEDKGLPFALNALNHLENGGVCAVITQSSAGSGGGSKTVKEILDKHTFIGSIEMHGDLFKPFASVGTHIYLFKAGIPHDFNKECLFSNMGEHYYKRTSRNMTAIGTPLERINDLINAFNDRDYEGELLVKAKITDNNLNYSNYVVYDTTPTHMDFVRTVFEYMDWQQSMQRQSIMEEIARSMEKDFPH